MIQEENLPHMFFAEELLKHKENEEILLSIGPEFNETSFYRVHTSNKNSVFYYD